MRALLGLVLALAVASAPAYAGKGAEKEKATCAGVKVAGHDGRGSVFVGSSKPRLHEIRLMHDGDAFSDAVGKLPGFLLPMVAATAGAPVHCEPFWVNDGFNEEREAALGWGVECKPKEGSRITEALEIAGGWEDVGPSRVSTRMAGRNPLLLTRAWKVPGRGFLFCAELVDAKLRDGRLYYVQP